MTGEKLTEYETEMVGVWRSPFIKHWDEGQHPRDDTGRFGRGGSKPVNKRKLTIDQADSGLRRLGYRLNASSAQHRDGETSYVVMHVQSGTTTRMTAHQIADLINGKKPK